MVGQSSFSILSAKNAKVHEGFELKKDLQLLCVLRAIRGERNKLVLRPRNPDGIEEAQLINYLKATGLEVGVLVNFGSSPRLEWKRLVLSKESVSFRKLT